MMKYRTLGATGLRVSEIGLGTENLQGKPYPVVEATVHAALDQGVNIFDVFMPNPTIRSDLGRALGARRKDVLLQGHIGAVMRGGQYARSRDPEECARFVQDFLERYGTDYIDIGMMHIVDTDADFEAAFHSPYMELVQSLKERGVIRYLGASSHNPETALRMVRTGLLDVLMFAINPAFDLTVNHNILDSFFRGEQLTQLQPDPARMELYQLCAARGVGITVMKTLGAGRLLRRETSSIDTALTIPQCVSYALDRPAVASVLLGAQSPEEVREAAAYEELAPSERDYSVLSRSSLPMLGGKCMYCNHCLPCVRGIDIASVTKYLDMARVSGPGAVNEHYAALTAHAGQCISCGACEKRCPFHIAIRENMHAAEGVFGY